MVFGLSGKGLRLASRLLRFRRNNADEPYGVLVIHGGRYLGGVADYTPWELHISWGRQHYLFLFVPFFFLLLALPLFVELTAVLGAGATFSPCRFWVVSSGAAVGSSSGGGGWEARR